MLTSHLSKVQFLKQLLALLLVGAALLGLTACELPQVRAEDRIFLPLTLDYLGEYRLPDTTWEGTRVGGLSGLAYDRNQNRFYAVSDDRSGYAPARFYSLKLLLQSPGEPISGIDRVEVEGVTLLKNPQGENYPPNSLDPEGIALTPQGTVFISSEGVKDQAPPFVAEFNLTTGAWLKDIALPDYFIPKIKKDGSRQGVGNNLGLESLSLSPTGERLFTATESALVQDRAPNNPGLIRTRLLHYLLGEPKSLLVAEHLYALEPTPPGATYHGLVELLCLDNGGHFLSLERTFTPGKGIDAKLFQVALGAATDVSTLAVLQGELSGIEPVRKQLLLDLNQLGIPLDNLEGMAIGPRLKDGSPSLLLVSDNNFQKGLSTQFLLFRLQGLTPG